MIYVSDSNVAVNYEKFNLGKHISSEKGYAASDLVLFSTLFDAQLGAWFFWDVMISVEVKLQREIGKKGI